MRDLLLLTKMSLKNALGMMKKKKKGKLVTGTAGLVLLGLFLAFCMSVNALSGATVYRAAGVPEMTLFTGALYALLISLMMAVMRGSASPKASDAELLLSLPLSRRTILLAKSAAKYLFEAAPVAVLFLPFLAVYCATTPVDVFTVLRGLLMLLAAPLLSVGLSYLLGWLFFKIGSRLQNPQHLGTVLSMVILVAFLVYNFSVSGSMGDATAMQAQLDAFPPAAWMMRFIAFGELRALLCVLAVTVLPFALGICLFSAVYGEKQQSFRSKKTGLDFTARTPRRALLRKEARRYFASSVYVVNTIFGLVMMAGGTAALLIFRAKALDFLASAEFFRLILAPLLAMAYSWMASTVYITAASISLEGRSLWILKANPVETRDIFAAKIQLNLLVAAPVTLLCSAVGAFALRLPLADALCVMLLPLLTTLLISVGGLYINLLFPKLDWTEEGAVVKQSMSAMLCFFLGGFFVVVPPVVYLLCFSHVPFLWAALAIAALYLLLTAFFWLRLRGDGSRRFAAL